MTPLRRRIRYLGLALPFLALVGVVGEQLGRVQDERRFPAPGARVDLGDGRRLYIDCRGAGSPAVILEAGHRNWSPIWALVQPRVAAFTRVCSYDRAGLGLSDAGPAPRSGAAVVADEARLLERAGVAPPYVLVGHSAGGLYHRLFAAAHREHVAGLVLLDSDAPGSLEDRQKIVQAPDDRRVAAVLTALTYSGVLRLLVLGLDIPLGPKEAQRYPVEVKVRLRAHMTRLALAVNGEWDSYRTAYRDVPAGPLGDLPVFVVGALGYRSDPADRADWRHRQEGLAALSTRSHLLVLENEPHPLPLLRPETVVDAVRTVVDEARAPHRRAAGPKDAGRGPEDAGR